MHTLIAGVSGSGKSYVENKLIKKLLDTDSALILIDPKRVELREYKDKARVIRYSVEVDDCIDCLYQAESTMMDRYREMQEKGLKEYDGGPLYVIMDEVAPLVRGDDKKEVCERLYQISSLGRAAKVFLIACTQRSTADILPRDIVVNMDIVCLRQRKPVDSRELIGIPDACKLPRIGYCYIFGDNFSRPIKVSSDEVWNRLEV
jgi:DNA segregation ATPase FtsK/SpoIIIE-like protein